MITINLDEEKQYFGCQCSTKLEYYSKLNLYTCECDQNVYSGALVDVAEFFKFHKAMSHISTVYIGMRLTVRFIPIYNPTRKAQMEPKKS